MSSTVDTATALNYWLASYTLAASTLPVILIYCAYFVFSTPRHRRWRTAFNLGLAPLVATLFFFISYVLTTYAYSQLPSVTFSDTVKRTLSYTSVILDNVQASSGEICLAWMVYKVYSRKKFKIILPFIVLFICLRFASQIWTSIMILSKLDPTVAGSVRGILMMWNLLFFSFLFIYRYRIKLKNAYKGPRFYKTVLDVSLRNAIIPTLFVLPAVITHFFTHNRIMALVNGILTISFRLLFGIAIANSLYIINRGEGGSRKDRRNIEMHAMNTRHGAASAITALHLASSFGLERKTNKILESFLANLHDLYGGTKGYFVEKNRFGQVNVICGFAYEDSKAFNGANICSVDDSSHRGDVPWAALEYGLELMEPMIWDAELADTDIDELSAIMSDRKDNIESILILPVTSPESGKQKIIYIEWYAHSNLLNHLSLISVDFELMPFFCQYQSHRRI
ncbi:hypothetical protein BKA69DRAFT_107797 [Paraphysoderma sedebokerense]|nr:hypothetical protein BKA69DRAFT_211506 [Paraphysoderma sedebokerense]KAI9136728.1 hypothetical protein BKA69DRAFT_107797 [Paraphysoderma sedebokerense]